VQLNPLQVAIIGALLGLGFCTAALVTESSEEAISWQSLFRFAGAGFLLFVILAYVRFGLGPLFGMEPARLLSFDSDMHHPKPGSLIAMWATLGASVELVVVAAWLAWRYRQNR
jgi:hypothetical protein